MKVGILTFHSAINYGAVLQTYATQELVRQMGFEAEVIDYHNVAIDRNYEVRRFHFAQLPKRNIYTAIKYILSCILNHIRCSAFRAFSRDYLHIGKRISLDSGDSLKGYDVILIGSDQVWNKELTNGFDDVYWGNFSTEGATRKIAWSACMNKTSLSSEEEEYIKDKINNFSAISVREDSLIPILKPYYAKSIVQTLDPTLLLSESDWEHLCKPVKEKNYIAVYALYYQSESFRVAEEIAQKEGLQVIYLHGFSESNIRKGHKQCSGPIEFLSYIKGAELVVTSSFHGAVFSIVFKKPFVCIDGRKKENVRVRVLLDCLDIERETRYADGIRITTSKEYDSNLDESDLVIESKSFLQKNLTENEQ